MQYNKLFTFVSISGLLFAACDQISEDDVEIVKIQKQLKKEYSASFTDTFGDRIDPEQTWGFDVDYSASDSTSEAASTRAWANTNSNEWANTYTVPDSPSAEEIQAVRDYLAEVTKYGQDLGHGVSISGFKEGFVQHVWKGTTSGVAKNNGTISPLSNQMNQLCVDGTHVNNFNAANGSIMLMKDVNNWYFTYHNSTDSKYHDEYYAFTLDGYDGYYVAFDFYANGQNPNQQVDQDYDYQDWIVKVVKAEAKPQNRIMCEDLGSIGDFDFNDVVFDVNLLNGAAYITLQAAGGTMPVYIQGNTWDTKYEVHDLFGVDVTTMVNTGNGTVTRDPVSFALWNINSVDEIHVYVTNTKQNNATYELMAETGDAPQKINVPSTVAWSPERVRIDRTYPKFGAWVKNSSNPFWK